MEKHSGFYKLQNFSLFAVQGFALKDGFSLQTIPTTSFRLSLRSQYEQVPDLPSFCSQEGNFQGQLLFPPFSIYAGMWREMV